MHLLSILEVLLVPAAVLGELSMAEARIENLQHQLRDLNCKTWHYRMGDLHETPSVCRNVVL